MMTTRSIGPASRLRADEARPTEPRAPWLRALPTRLRGRRCIGSRLRGLRQPGLKETTLGFERRLSGHRADHPPALPAERPAPETRGLEPERNLHREEGRRHPFRRDPQLGE